MGFSNAVKKSLLDSAVGATAYSAPATLYFALLVGGVEVSQAGYARAAVTNNTTSFPDAAAGSPYIKHNGVAIAFPLSGESWGAVDEVRIYDAAVAGNEIARGPLAAPVLVPINRVVRFPVNALTFTST